MFFTLLLTIACAPETTRYCGEVIEVSTAFEYDRDDEEATPGTCYDEGEGGSMDLSDCCPDGYDAVGLDVNRGAAVCLGRCAGDGGSDA